MQLWQNCRTISLISYSRKVMLKVIFNRLKLQAEEMSAEEQAGFRAGRSITKQIFNLRTLCESISNTSRICPMSSMILKKAFDRVWHAALWATMHQSKSSSHH